MLSRHKFYFLYMQICLCVAGRLLMPQHSNFIEISVKICRNWWHTWMFIFSKFKCLLSGLFCHLTMMLMHANMLGSCSTKRLLLIGFTWRNVHGYLDKRKLLKICNSYSCRIMSDGDLKWREIMDPNKYSVNSEIY